MKKRRKQRIADSVVGFKRSRSEVHHRSEKPQQALTTRRGSGERGRGCNERCKNARHVGMPSRHIAVLPYRAIFKKSNLLPDGRPQTPCFPSHSPDRWTSQSFSCAITSTSTKRQLSHSRIFSGWFVQVPIWFAKRCIFFQ